LEKAPADTGRPWPARLPFFYGWVILPAAALAIFVSGPGQTYSVSQFVDPLIEEFGWSRTAIAGLYTAGSLTAAATMIGIGWLLDRLGARLMLVGIGICLGLAALWMSNVDNKAEVYVGFAALRIFGQGSLGLIPSTLVALWFVRKRGRATAIAGLGMVASQAVFPPLIHTLITRIGWRETWVVMAIVVWVLLVPVAVFIIRRSPESVGLRPDGLVAPPTPVASDTSHTPLPQVEGWTLGESARSLSFWLVMVTAASASLVTTAFVFHQAAVFDSRGLSAGVSAAVLSVMGPMSLGGAFAGGFLADRYPNRFLLLVGQALIVVGAAFALTMSTTWQAFAYGAVIGFASGGLITVNAVVWPNYFGRRHLGKIRGAAIAATVGGAALGPLPFAIAFDILGSYTSVLALFTAFPAVSMVAAILAKPPHRRQPLP
jgi:MFS family permease